jgi:hypothetical protein
MMERLIASPSPVPSRSAAGHQPEAEALLEYGADIGRTDHDGDATIDHARGRGQVHVVTLLESWPSGR